MSIIHGSTTITTLKHNTTNITTAYHGSTQVFTSGCQVSFQKTNGVNEFYYSSDGGATWDHSSTNITVTIPIVTLKVYVTLSSNSYNTDMTSTNPRNYTISGSSMIIKPYAIAVPRVTVKKTKLFGKSYSYLLTGITNGDSQSIYVVQITNASGSAVSLGQTISGGGTSQTYTTSLGTSSGSPTFTLTYQSRANYASSYNYTTTATIS